jgi:sugar O-acyltransferase (sialic acid O-acetyltransferase NeuD family)
LKKKPLLIFGTGDLAKVVIGYFLKDSEYDVSACVATRDAIRQSNFMGFEIVPFEEVESAYPPEEFQMFIAVGYKRMNHIRARFYHEAKGKGYKLATYISSRALCMEGVTVGENCLICENSVIHISSRIGDNTVISGGCYIAHNNAIGDHVFSSAHFSTGGYVKIGNHAFLGLNSCVTEKINVAPYTVVGAGVTISKDTKEWTVYKAQNPKTGSFDLESAAFYNV